MRGAALAALLLAAEAFLQPRRPGPTTALAARKRSQRGKEKGSADHSSVDDWTGRRRRRIRDDVEAALDDPNWFGNRGEAYEVADDDPMAGWFDEESMVADGMGAGRARAVMARRRAIADFPRGVFPFQDPDEQKPRRFLPSFLPSFRMLQDPTFS